MRQPLLKIIVLLQIGVSIKYPMEEMKKIYGARFPEQNGNIYASHALTQINYLDWVVSMILMALFFFLTLGNFPLESLS